MLIHYKVVSAVAKDPVVEALMDKLQRFSQPLATVGQEARMTLVNMGHGMRVATSRMGRVFRIYTPDLHSEAEIPAQPLSVGEAILLQESSMLGKTVGEPIKTDLHPLPKLAYAHFTASDNSLDNHLKEKGLQVVSNGLDQVSTKARLKYREDIRRVKASCNSLIEQLKGVKALLEMRKENPALKAQIDAYLRDAFKLDRAIVHPSYMTSVGDRDILDKIADKVYQLVTRQLDFLEQLQKDNYSKIMLLDAIPGSEVGQQNLREGSLAFVARTDPRERIFYVCTPDAERCGVADTLSHEITHTTSDTLDYTYFHSVKENGVIVLQGIRGGDLTGINVLDYRYYTQKSETLTRFILNIPSDRQVTESEIEYARKLLENNKLVSSDVLLNTAEFDTFLFRNLYERFGSGPSRSTREATDPSAQQTGGRNLSDAIQIAILRSIL